MFNFINNQLLRMEWLNTLVGNFLQLIGLNPEALAYSVIQFLIYDTIKILILLTVLIYIISYIQSYFPPERTKKIIGKYKGVKANIFSALLGTVTPFCSCSSIPLFIGFTASGLPVGVTFSFLISSPLVDMASIILLNSIFGWKITLIYVIFGLMIAVLGGLLIQKMGMEKYVEGYITDIKEVNGQEKILTSKKRHQYAIEQVKFTVKKVFKYILIGVGIGALIHNLVPATMIERFLGPDNPFAVIAATLFGIPIYADIFGTLPVAESLYTKGASIGTVVALLMSVTALSLPSLIMLRQAVKPKLIAVFTIIVGTGIILTGYILNILAYRI